MVAAALGLLLAVVALFALPGCSIEGAPVPGPASVAVADEPTCTGGECRKPQDACPYPWAEEEARAFGKRHGLPGTVRIEFRDQAGVERSGCFAAPDRIVIYTRGSWGWPCGEARIRHVLRHELLHWYDHCKGITAPPNGKHEAEFDARIAKEWPE